MKKYTVFILFWSIISGMTFAQNQGPDFVPDKIYVKIRNDFDYELPVFKQVNEKPDYTEYPQIGSIIDQYSVTAMFKPFKTPNRAVQQIYEWHIPDPADLEHIIADIATIPWIEYAEKIPYMYQHYDPNDVHFMQWHLEKISSRPAWSRSQGDRNIIIAVVDDAVRLTHEDLQAQIWVNPGEIPGDSIDNDGNGWIDDVNGYDLANNDNDPNPPAGATNFTFGHGTHTSGLATATTDNNTGIASISFNVTLMPVKTKVDSTIGNNQLQDTYGGVDYAIVNHADVISMSFGSEFYNSSMDYLCQAADLEGIVCVASAGNTGTYDVSYPAGYFTVISVGSTKASDEKSGFSTYHAGIDVMAPGSSIYSTAAGSNSSYVTMSGTSMSCPLVSGLVGLMLSADSTLSTTDVRNCLRSGCDNIDALNPNYVGWIGAGRINAENTMICFLGVGNESALPNGFQVNRLYPNPATGRAMLSANLPWEDDLKITIFDATGSHSADLYDGRPQAGAFEKLAELPEGFSSGLYYVRWSFGNEVLTQKLNIIK